MLFPKCPCCAAATATIRKLAVSDGAEEWHNARGQTDEVLDSCRTVFVALGGYMYGETIIHSTGGRCAECGTVLRWDDDDGARSLESESILEPEAYNAASQQGAGALPWGRMFSILNSSLYWTVGATTDGTQYVQTFDAETLAGDFAAELEDAPDNSFRGIAPSDGGAIVLRGGTELQAIDASHSHPAYFARILCDIGRFDWIDSDGNAQASYEWVADYPGAIVNAVCGRDGRGYLLAAMPFPPHTSHTLGDLVLGAAVSIINNAGSLVAVVAIADAWLFPLGTIPHVGQAVIQGQILADETGLFILCGWGNVDATGHTFDGRALLVRTDLDGNEEWRWRDPDEPNPYGRTNRFVPDFVGGVLEYARRRLRRISGGAVLWEAEFDDGRDYAFVASQCVPDGDHFYVTGQGSSGSGESFERFQILKVRQSDGLIEWAALHDINGRRLLDCAIEGDYVYVVGEPGRTEDEDEE